jgi:hypothetical protein
MPSARETSLAQLAVGRTGRAGDVLEGNYQFALWSLLLVGFGVRLAFTASTAGNRFDLGSAVLVAQALIHHPGHVYSIMNMPGVEARYPYLPGYFPGILLVKGVSGLTGLSYTKLWRVPVALADLAIAWAVQDYVRSRGASLAAGLASAALVALGPSFVAISGVHGQIDSIAILPAVIALSVWERAAVGRRAWIAGLLIGLGASIKTVPAFMLLALLPSARSRREALELVGATLVVPLVAALPMVIAAGTGWISTLLHYHGGSGLGGLSLVAQPDLPLNWLHVGADPLTGVSLWLIHHGNVIAEVALLAAFVVLLRFRAPAPLAAVVIWLTVYAFGVSFFMQYMVWGLPFFLMAGYRRQALALQLLLVAPLFVIYHGTLHPWVAYAFYVAPMLLVWLALTAAMFVVGRRVAQRRSYSAT